MILDFNHNMLCQSILYIIISSYRNNYNINLSHNLSATSLSPSPELELLSSGTPSYLPIRNRKRRGRTTFSDEVRGRLNSCFRKDPYPDIVARESLAKETGVDEARIQVIIYIYTIYYNLWIHF